MTDETKKRIKLDHFGFAKAMAEEGVLCNPGFANDYIRFVTHRDVNRKDCETAIKAVKSIMKL